MDSVVALLAEAERRAISIGIVGESLKIDGAPKDFLFVQKLIARKTEIIKHLTGADDAAPPNYAEWPEPLPLPTETPGAPVFSLELLPESFRTFVADIAHRMQSPPDFAAVAMMIAAAAAIGTQVAIRPKSKDDWSVVPNLWGCVIGRPSVMKTPSIREPLKMLQRLEALDKERYEKEAEEKGYIQTVVDAEIKALKAQIEKLVRNGDKPAAIDLAKEMQALESPDIDPPRRFVVNDATIPKLGEILRDNPCGVLQYRDELLGYLRTFERDDSQADRAAVLELWDGQGCHVTDRIGRGTIAIQRACISLIGTIQPGPLQAFFAGAIFGGGGDDGLIQRLQLMVWPNVDRQWQMVDQFPDSVGKEMAWKTMQRLAVIGLHDIGAEHPDDGIPYLRFDEAAQRTFSLWLKELEHRLRSDDMPEVLEAHLAKYRSLMPSLALIIHLADVGEGPVGPHTVDKAVAWCDYLEGHARRVYAAAIDYGTTAATKLVEKIKAGKVADGFGARDVYRHCWSGLTKETSKAAIDLLVDHRWLMPVTEVTPGKPRFRYRLNPRAFSKKGPKGN